MKYLLFLTTIAYAQIIVVSDRADFYDPNALSEHERKMWVDLDFPIASQSVTDKQWKEALKEKKVAVLVHGFNNQYEDSLNLFYSIIENTLKTYDICICYLWPGGNNWISYFSAKQREGTLTHRFAHLLEDITSHASFVDVIAHSMGCRLSLEALSIPSSLTIRHLFLLAPAVNSNSLEPGEEFGRAIYSSKSIYVFFSRNDSVVYDYYPLAEWAFALGAIGPAHPDLLHSNIFSFDCSDSITNHHAYLESEHIFSLIDSALIPIVTN